MKVARLQRDNYSVGVKAGQGGDKLPTGFSAYGRDGLPLAHPVFICAWCKGVVDSKGRSDRKYCGRRCRQASWRFRVVSCADLGNGCVKRLVYADPPYPGLAGYYPEQAEVDHGELVRSLENYDGWALSTSAVALGRVLRLIDDPVRVCAWFRPERSGSGWEPLIVRAARYVSRKACSDTLIYRGRYRAFPGAMIGMKPPQFAEWMFSLLGARSGDTFEDLYPGSGAVTEAWSRYMSLGPSYDASLGSRSDVFLRELS